MNLIIDIGNTRIKLAVFESDNLKFVEIASPHTLIDSLYEIKNQYNIVNAIVSSVTEIPAELELFLHDLTFSILLSSDTVVPFVNQYENPATLGVDRIALVTAASVKFPKQDVLVIDAGTCITYDFLTHNNNYLGGAISPGINMRLQAMNYFTKKLPLIQFNDKELEIGNSTENAILFGALNGVLAEIEGFIAHFSAKSEKLTVVLTGGDSIFLAKRLKNSIFANSNFLLEGLNSILAYNLKISNESS